MARSSETVLWEGTPVFRDSLSSINPFGILAFVLLGAAALFVFLFFFQLWIFWYARPWWAVTFLLPAFAFVYTYFHIRAAAQSSGADAIFSQKTPITYTITNTVLRMPGWTGWYEVGYPRNERWMNPDPVGTIHEIPLKNILLVDVERSQKDIQQGTATLEVRIASTIFKEGSGQMRVYQLEHVKDYASAVDLLKKKKSK